MNRTYSIEESPTVAFSEYVRNRVTLGSQIVQLQIGDPEFPTHQKIIEACYISMLNGETKYCDSRGLLELRQEIRRKVIERNNIKQISVDNILVTHGAVHGINLIINSLIRAGDECIILEPYWRSYESTVRLAGGQVVIIPPNHEDGFHLNLHVIEECITPKTKLIIINSPNNPSGAVYKESDLVKLCELAKNNNAYVVSDEVYESIVFDERKNYSPGSNFNTFDNVISVFSFSKTYSMTGWRIGYIVATKSLINEFLKISQFSVTCISPFVQSGALLALADKDVASYMSWMVNQYQARRDFIFENAGGCWLEDALIKPQGTFYALIDCKKFNLPSAVLATKLVDGLGLALTPGAAFGRSMDNYLRLCFATSENNLIKALKALKELPSYLGKF